MHTAVICAVSYRMILPTAYYCASYGEAILNDMNEGIAWIGQQQVPGLLSKIGLKFHAS